MARKEIDKTKSATFNEGAINDNFEELYEGAGGGGGITLDDLKAQVTVGDYGSAKDVGGDIGGVKKLTYAVVNGTKTVSGTGTARIDGQDVPINVSFTVDKVENTSTYIADPPGITQRHLVEDVNTIRLIKDMKDSVINVSGQYGHEPNMIIHNGKAYITYVWHENGNDEGWDATISDYRKKSKVRLSIVNLSTMLVEKSVTVVDVHGSYTENGQTTNVTGDSFTYDGATYEFWSAGTPAIALINGNIRIVFNGTACRNREYASATNMFPLAYRDYNISNETLGDIGLCTIAKNGTTEIATLANFKSLIENAGTTITVGGEYAKINDKYYIAIANGATGLNGHIFTTEDFIDFEWFAEILIPDFPNGIGLRYEISVFPWYDAWTYCSLYIAVRRQYSYKSALVCKMHTGLYYENGVFKTSSDKSPGQIDFYKQIPCCSSKLWFFSQSSSIDFLETKDDSHIYLVVDNARQTETYRGYTDIIQFEKNTVDDSTVTRIAQCLTMTYPSVLYNNDYYYAAYQARLYNDNQPHILLSRFRPFSANWDKVIAGLSKMLDTFEPSNT